MGIFEKDRDLTEAPDEVCLVVDASTFRVKARGFAMRLDHFLSHHLKWRSRSSVQTLVKDGYVEIDAARPDAPEGTGERHVETRAGAKVRHGSRVYIRIPDEYRTLLIGDTSDELAILYEDDDALAVDKPPLVAVHPSGRYMTDTLIQRVHKRYQAQIEAGRMLPRLCHRLDRETSGIVLVGKRPETQGALTTQFEDRLVEKEYLAILAGELATTTGSTDLPIRLSTTSPIDLEMTTAAGARWFDCASTRAVSIRSVSTWRLSERHWWGTSSTGPTARSSCARSRGRRPIWIANSSYSSDTRCTVTGWCSRGHAAVSRSRS